ncbi:response regulator transcription factor [Stieleria varia]|uniref:Sensory transduction protein regX3 n=1 Tax=Stieleria varia TaxID=2528005 RepID=A0A5C6B9C5_9BACT|nr:response regulator transcription factor [Stieleria varia]TWU08041.1 Sensory transduction protein regX3 [Stieleria varia]
MRPHILVVEDEKHLGVGIKYNLEAENYRVTLVEDGPTALKLIDASPDNIDLIVLDLMLPGMSGYTVCETIRDAGQTMPVLMLSARTLAEDRARGFDVGANQYMNKPFELDELLSRVKNLLQLAGHSANGAPRSRVRETVAHPEPIVEIQFGNIEVHFLNHEVNVNGKRVRMTPKELRLLKYFVENPNRVINRTELLSQVWEVSGNLQTRSVDQFIARLRKIIEPDSTAPIHLLTVRDAGYRFILHPDATSTDEDETDDEAEDDPDEHAEDDSLDDEDPFQTYESD